MGENVKRASVSLILIAFIVFGVGCATQKQATRDSGPPGEEDQTAVTAKEMGEKAPGTGNSGEDSTLPTPWFASADQETLHQRLHSLALEIDSQWIERANSFALASFRDLYTQSQDSNIIYSPASLYIALGMAREGAEAETRQQFDELMGLESADEQAFLNATWAALTYLNAKGSLLAVENELDVAEEIPLHESYRQLLSKVYGVQWGVQDEDLTIRNIIEFDGAWTTPFEEADTNPRPFHLAGGDVALTDQMRRAVHGEERYLFRTGAGHTAAILGYGDEEDDHTAEMRLFVPAEAEGLPGLIEGMDPGFISGSDFVEGRGSIALPPFGIEREMSLNTLLQENGLVQAFTDFADFSRMSPAPLKIVYVKQKARIEVNEEGTEAKAVTEIGMAITSIGHREEIPSLDFRADRPFLYAIVDRPTGLLLFLGTVTDPRQ